MITASELQNRVAIVTGAASGIGAATAVALARNGVKVLCFDLSPSEDTLTRIAEAGGIASSIQGDMSVAADVRRATAAARTQFGPIDIAVNCAGVISNTPVTELGQSEWDRTIAINLTGTFHLTQSVLDEMIERRSGRLIFLTSVAARTGGVRSGPAYAAAKGGVAAMAKWTAQFAAPHGVTVNTVAPGPVATPMIDGLAYSAEAIPLARFGDPDEIASAVVYLASDAAAWTTGQTLDVNGGVFMN